MSSFSVTFRTTPAAQILDLNGELDAHTAQDLEVAIQTSLSNGKFALVINGANLRYISSAGLGVFMAFVEEVRESGGDIKIVALQPQVYDTFDLLGFPHLFDVLPTLEEAEAKFMAGELRH
ncbi:MAG: STAS domain-containing protein [Bacteroidetes Order II. Incertae sedis bacterium]|nr:STAS domain-containing protein [Bacteroidetes Order II. bacterium]